MSCREVIICMGCLGPAQCPAARAHHSGIRKGRHSHQRFKPAAIPGPEGGEYIPIRKHKRQDGVPSLELTKEDAVKIQLAVRVVLNPCSHANAAHVISVSCTSVSELILCLHNPCFCRHYEKMTSLTRMQVLSFFTGEKLCA